MNKPLRVLLANLDVIANIKENDKLFLTKNWHIGLEEYPEHSYQQAFSRWWSRESRDTTWEYLEFIIEMAIDYTNLKSSFKNEIFKKLVLVKGGLNHLQETYRSEISLVSKINTLILSINSIIPEDKIE